MSAVFLSFEGIEGAGKTTLAQWLVGRLQEEGIDCWLTCEPWQPSLRQLLLEAEQLSQEAELLLFVADRALHAQAIREALSRGKTVICDRYADSTVVYQGYGRNLDVEWVRALNSFATQGLMPLRTYLLDVPVSLGLQRQQRRNRLGSESAQFYERVRQGFLREAALAPQRYLLIDATLPLSQVQKLLWDDVSRLLASV